MTEVLHFSQSSPNSTALPCTPTTSNHSSSSSSSSLFLINQNPPVEVEEEGEGGVSEREEKEGGEGETECGGDQQLSLLALLVTLFRKSMVACKSDREELCAMDIGWPTNVRHVAHVTFDRFNGFLGLPVEFEPDVPRRAPSASASVFGVSTESMQLSYDSRGNSVPTILLLMQRNLYTQGGLQAEGIFRINAENGQEEYVREQLNRGVVPEGIDVHCLAGLIKAWFRELPTGVLDSLNPEQVIQCQSEEECSELVRLLPPTEAALLDWAINLMADVVQEEHQNKMNARNIAMVFAPNMTQMADPLTALMYAVQVMNFLKTLIVKTLREREDRPMELACPRLEPSDENGHHSPSLPCVEDSHHEDREAEQVFIAYEPDSENHADPDQNNSINKGGESHNLATSQEKLVHEGDGPRETPNKVDTFSEQTETEVQSNDIQNKGGKSTHSSSKRGTRKVKRQKSVSNQVNGPVEKTREISNLSRINSRTEWSEWTEAWR
ncbi:Rho GTPase-activating protein domain [Dillenia turbinata]|uniref:Rho GTPase-activating protein domain n=1 Tax=Dillenia turbinata TaxID=194707 RepID=A0AAN8V7Z2_9MAGN